MRNVLWVLGSLGVLWAVFWLYALTAMGAGGGMGGSGGMMGSAAPAGPMTGEMSLTAGAMIGGMLTQTLAMLGLIGVFIYLVTDALRNR